MIQIALLGKDRRAIAQPTTEIRSRLSFAQRARQTTPRMSSYCSKTPQGAELRFA